MEGFIPATSMRTTRWTTSTPRFWGANGCGSLTRLCLTGTSTTTGRSTTRRGDSGGHWGRAEGPANVRSERAVVLISALIAVDCGVKPRPTRILSILTFPRSHCRDDEHDAFDPRCCRDRCSIDVGGLWSVDGFCAEPPDHAAALNQKVERPSLPDFSYGKGYQSGVTHYLKNNGIFWSVLSDRSHPDKRDTEGDIVVLGDGSLLAAWSDFYTKGWDDGVAVPDFDASLARRRPHLGPDRSAPRANGLERHVGQPPADQQGNGAVPVPREERTGRRVRALRSPLDRRRQDVRPADPGRRRRSQSAGQQRPPAGNPRSDGQARRPRPDRA